jgi:uroporphyrinogen decarboxylase
MENYFIKMYENPDVVEAVTERVLDFYCEANRMVLDEMGDLIDVFFFGNDFGTQLDLFMSPAMFERFVLPGIKRLVDTVKKYGKPVMLHSCGSIVKAIPMIIEAGVDGIHPVQAGAVGMEAEKLAPEYGADLAFMGGVDTQNLLPFGSPDDVAGEVERLMGVFGPNYIISPSHEALLANVSPENLIAMSTAAKGKTTAGS